MFQSEGVADFVSRKLPQTRQRHFHHLGRNGFTRLVGREQALGNQIILPHAQRAERDVAFNDFTGAGIHHAYTIRPPARCAVHPLNYVVTQIHRIGVFG